MQNTHGAASMNTQIAEPGKKPVRGNQTLAKRVREALLSWGGEAHRAVVFELIA